MLFSGDIAPPVQAAICRLMPITITERELIWHSRRICPEPRGVQPLAAGPIVSIPEVGGLHHRYERRAA
jgi:hypothetical protein